MENVIIDLAEALRERLAIIRDEESRRALQDGLSSVLQNEVILGRKSKFDARK